MMKTLKRQKIPFCLDEYLLKNKMTHFQYYLNKATSFTQPKSRNIKDKTRACDPREKMDKHITKIIEY